jgi:hypothetical protein
MSDEMAASVLARAIADALIPERSAHNAALAEALYLPAMTRTLELLTARGYRLERMPA